MEETPFLSFWVSISLILSLGFVRRRRREKNENEKWEEGDAWTIKNLFYQCLLKPVPKPPISQSTFFLFFNVFSWHLFIFFRLHISTVPLSFSLLLIKHYSCYLILFADKWRHTRNQLLQNQVVMPVQNHDVLSPWVVYQFIMHPPGKLMLEDQIGKRGLRVS